MYNVLRIAHYMLAHCSNKRTVIACLTAQQNAVLSVAITCFAHAALAHYAVTYYIPLVDVSVSVTCSVLLLHSSRSC